MKYTEILREVTNPHGLIKVINDFRIKNPSVSWKEIAFEKSGDTILHIAARVGRADIISYIITTWPPLNTLNVRNNDWKTPLHEAAQSTQVESLNVLLKYEAQIDAINRGNWTPLMMACSKTGEQAFETVRTLIEKGADVKLKNTHGWTCLHVACRSGDAKIVKFLLESCEPELITSCTNNGRSLLHIACLNGQLNVVKILLELCNFDANVVDDCGNTPIHEAVGYNNIEIIKVLLDYGANINWKNRIGLTVLHFAAAKGHADLIRYFIVDLGMDPNVLTPDNMTALHYAGRTKNHDTIQTLLELGTDPAQLDFLGRPYLNFLNI